MVARQFNHGSPPLPGRTSPDTHIRATSKHGSRSGTSAPSSRHVNHRPFLYPTKLPYLNEQYSTPPAFSAFAARARIAGSSSGWTWRSEAQAQMPS